MKRRTRTRLRTKASLLLHRRRRLRRRHLEVIPTRGMREIDAAVAQPHAQLGRRAH